MRVPREKLVAGALGSVPQEAPRRDARSERGGREKNGKIMMKNMGKSWEITGKTWENHGKTGKSWEKHGTIMGKPW